MSLLAAPAVLGALGWVPLRSVLQFRASYPGGLTYIGQVKGALGTEYYRVYLWRTSAGRSPLPDLRVHLHGTPYALSELTEPLVRSLGGATPEGAPQDAAEYYFWYRFEEGLLTYQALYPAVSTRPPAPQEHQTDRFFLQMGDGPPFALPQSQGQLIANAGRPLGISRNIAN